MFHFVVCFWDLLILQGRLLDSFLLYLCAEICELFSWPPPLISWICIQDCFSFNKKPHKILPCCFLLKLLLIAWEKLILMVVMLPQHLSSPSPVLTFRSKNPFFIHFHFSNQFPKPIQLYPSLMPNWILCGVEHPPISMFWPQY